MTRFPASLSTAMHGTELCQPDEPGASPLRSPISVFPGNRINASWRAATPSSLSRKLATAFRSPATAALSSLHSGVNAPDLLLRSLRAPSTARSAARLHALFRFAPGEGRFSASCPLRLPMPAWPAVPPASTPLQEFYLPTDQSVLPDLLPADPPSDSARSPFAPRRRFLLLGFSAADPRFRSATFSEACCSSNLLEPPSLCARSPGMVN